MKGKYKSKFEKKTATQLKRAKVKFKYESRRIPYTLACHYTPDWEIETPTGVLIVETKGYFKPEDRRKLAAVKRQHPEIDIRIVFYKRVPQYIRWAEKHGFKYAVEKVPKEWLKGL